MTAPSETGQPAGGSTARARGRGPVPVRRSLVWSDLSPARVRVLEHLRELPTDVTVDELAEAFDQHPNTVREHLDALVAAGLVVRERRPGPGRGRPAWRYRAHPQQPEPDPRVREYAALAGALAAHLAANSPDPRAEARQAGQRWGRALIDAPPVPPPGVEARAEVVRLLTRLDFSPRPNRNSTRVVLTTCPLLEMAQLHPEVVCAVHEGMVAGALDAQGAPSEGVTLTPVGAPQGCVLAVPGSRAVTTPRPPAGGLT